MRAHTCIPMIQCLENPQKPFYIGGIIKNPELNDGLEGWNAIGDAKIHQRESRGNKFIVAHNRNQPNDSVSQKIYMRKNNLYTLSGTLIFSSSSINGCMPLSSSCLLMD